MSIQFSMLEPAIRTIEKMDSPSTQALVVKTPLIEAGYNATTKGAVTVEQQVSFVVKQLSTFKCVLPMEVSRFVVILSNACRLLVYQ
jgi:hypothetical protein